jgi:uncharacterized protein
MSRVIHFDITADDPERAAAFYRLAFGWKIEKWAGPIEYWLATTGGQEQPGIDGAIMPRQGAFSGVYNTVGTQSLEASLEKVKAAGGETIGEINTIPGVGYFAYCKDTEGNIFGVMQSDPAAG